MEAAFYLVAARIALKTLPFRHLEPLFKRPPKAREISKAERDLWKNKIKKSISKAGRYQPLKTTCFTRAMAAQAMLRHRGVKTTLFYGAARLPGSGLRTHVWLKEGTEGIVGYVKASDYHILARYQTKEME